jgi:tetratricopeptide (TPR) repeat protein
MIQNRLDEAIKFRESKEYEQAETILYDLLKSEPQNAEVNYQMAWLCDAQGKESDAVPYYEQAIQSGLKDDDLRGALLGLGSTYRCLGRYADSIRTLRKGMETFPSAREFPIFLAMALYNTDEHHEAMSLLLKNLVETTQAEDILKFKSAILFYHDKLDETWD